MNPLTFDCPNCQANVEVFYLKVGEIAQCKSCGQKTPVPNSAKDFLGREKVPPTFKSGTIADLENSPKNSSIMDSKILQVNRGKSAWSPKGFKWIAFFFTFFPAMIIAAYNWDYLGESRRKKSLIYLAVGLFPIWFLLIWISDGVIADKLVTILLGLLNWTIGSYLGLAQVSAFNKFRETGGEKRSYGWPIANSFFFTVAVLATLFGVIFYQDGVMEGKFNAGRKALNELRYKEARDIFVDISEYYEDEPALYYNLAAVYQGLDNTDSMAYWLLAGQHLSPDDIDFKNAITFIVENSDWHPRDGQISTWYESGVKKLDCNFLDNQLHGIVSEYWANGNIKRRIVFVEGTAHGQFSLWNSEGSKLVVGWFKDGKYDGPITTTHPETNITDTVAIYDHGLLIFGRKWDDLGLLPFAF